MKKKPWVNSSYDLRRKDKMSEELFIEPGDDDEDDIPKRITKKALWAMEDERVSDIKEGLEEHEDTIESLKVQINILKKHDKDTQKQIKNLKDWVKSFADMNAKLQEELESIRAVNNITAPLVLKRNTRIITDK